MLDAMTARQRLAVVGAAREKPSRFDVVLATFEPVLRKRLNEGMVEHALALCLERVGLEDVEEDERQGVDLALTEALAAHWKVVDDHDENSTAPRRAVEDANIEEIVKLLDVIRTTHAAVETAPMVGCEAPVLLQEKVRIVGQTLHVCTPLCRLAWEDAHPAATGCFTDPGEGGGRGGRAAAELRDTGRPGQRVQGRSTGGLRPWGLQGGRRRKGRRPLYTRKTTRPALLTCVAVLDVVVTDHPGNGEAMGAEPGGAEGAAMVEPHRPDGRPACQKSLPRDDAATPAQAHGRQAGGGGRGGGQGPLLMRAGSRGLWYEALT